MADATSRLCVATIRDKPSGFTIRRIVGINDLWVTEYAIKYGAAVWQTISIMEFQKGKVIHETQYFAEPFEAPAWRSQWVEKKQIATDRWRVCFRLGIGLLMDHYDAIVIGSGQAGTPLSISLAGAGRKTVLVESQHVGGTCINVGCTPTKTMVASARVAYLARRAADFGVGCGPVGVDMGKSTGASRP